MKKLVFAMILVLLSTVFVFSQNDDIIGVWVAEIQGEIQGQQQSFDMILTFEEETFSQEVLYEDTVVAGSMGNYEISGENDIIFHVYSYIDPNSLSEVELDEVISKTESFSVEGDELEITGTNQNGQQEWYTFYAE